MIFFPTLGLTVFELILFLFIENRKIYSKVYLIEEIPLKLRRITLENKIFRINTFFRLIQVIIFIIIGKKRNHFLKINFYIRKFPLIYVFYSYFF